MNFSYNLLKVNRSLLIQIQPNALIKGDYELLNTVLDADIGVTDDVLEFIDEVLSEQKSNGYIGGNIAGAYFDKDKTVIRYDVGPEDPERCELPTWLFREIVEVWLKEAKKHFDATHPNLK